MPSKKKRNLKIFYPEVRQEEPPRKSVKTLIQETVNPLTYNSLVTGRKQKPVKPCHVRFVKRSSRLRHSLPLFRKIAGNARKFCSRYQKDFNILKELDWIVPFEFFGCREHKKNFHRIVKKLLSRSSGESIYTKSVISNFQFQKVPWLKNFNNKHMLWRRYWYYGNIWLLEKIVNPIVNRFFFSLKDAHSYEIKYIPKHLWYSYEAKIFNKLKRINWITEANEHERSVRGTLHVHPKNGLRDYEKFRLLMRVKNKRTQQQKRTRMIIFSYATMIGCAQRGDFYMAWNNYLSEVGNQKIYAAKIDISDAYGNVNIDILTNLIRRMPCTNEIKVSLGNYLRSQYVKLRSSEHAGKVFKWDHGLLQGDYLSSAFCELYMSYMDNKYLRQLCKPSDFLHRTVDDYFFCSIEPEHVSRFINVMMIAHKVNTEKTQSTEAPHCDREFEYCGRLINIRTKEVGGLYKFKEKTALRYRFKLFNKYRVVDSERLLLRAMYYPYNNYHFNKVIINTVYNSERKVLQNYFHSMIYLAYKFDVALTAIYQKENISLYGRILADTVWHYSQRSLGYINKYKGENNTGRIKFLTLVKIGYQAFYLVLKRKYMKYKILVEKIQEVSARINLRHYRSDDFKKMPACFLKIRMSRVLNIVKQ